MRLLSPLLALVLALSLTPLAHAGPLDERAADAHLRAVAAGDVDALMAQYGDDPWMDWVGGALDGRYRGSDAIRGVWQKFVANNDGPPRTLTRTTITQNANPKGVTLTAVAEFAGKTTVRVRHVLVFRDAKLVTEIWQNDSSASLTPAAP